MYEGDAILSTKSLVLLGVYDNPDNAIEDVLDDMAMALMFNEQHTAEDTRKFLKEHHQTHGFIPNYIIKTAELNKMEEVL